MGGLISSAVQAYDYSNHITPDGVEYGFHQGDKNGPLLIAMTTDIKESLSDVYSPIGGLLAKKGYSIAAIDVTCHGKDLKKKEKYGLDCWRSRADKSESNIFESYTAHVKSVISDIAKTQQTDTSNVTALGVSRGGYLAMKTAAELPEITIVIALAPVTDVFRLREFDDASASRSLYSIKPFYPVLSKKHLFLQINNNDDRVGTDEAISLIRGVVAAGGQREVDLTAVITPRKGHSTSEHEAAAAWAVNARKAGVEAVQMAPPK